MIDQSEDRTSLKENATSEIAKSIASAPLDDWTRIMVASAIAAAYSGLYRLAASQAKLARLDGPRRPSFVVADSDVAELTREQMATMLETVLVMRVRQQPAFRG